MQNIIFLVSNLHLWGGGERVTTLLANHFASTGYRVTILSVAIPEANQRFAINANIHIEYLNIKLDGRFSLFPKIESYFALLKYVNTSNEPTILLGMGNYPTLLAALLPRKSKFKTVGCQHGSFASVKNLWKVMRLLTYGRLDAVVSLTYRDAPKLLKHNKKVWVIPNPATFYPAQPAKLENRIILAVGRIDFQKGYDLMLDVLDRFVRENKDWRLRIIGDGPLKSAIQHSITGKGLTGKVSVLPATSQIPEEYLNASIFLMTSRTEGLPMVLLEAQACGLPIVAFDCETGPAEIVNHGEDGYLVKPGNTTEMCELLLELASDFDKRKAFGARARENVKRFLPNDIYRKWDDLFQNL